MASNFYLSTNMNLPVPTVGQDPGPDYASNLNAALTLVDSHNHSAGQGVQITPSGLNINADLPFNVNNLVTARSVRFSPQVTPINGVTDLGCVYEAGVDLYYNDGNGNQVRITQSGGVAGSPGSIASLTSPASATYVSANQTFVWQSDASTPANLDAGSVIIRNVTASSNGITISAPGGLASSYSLTLPALPGAQKFMTLDASGNIAAPWAVDGSTIEVNANTVQVKAGGITTTQIAAGTIVAANIAAGTITATEIANTTITAAKIVANTITNSQISTSTLNFGTYSPTTSSLSNLTQAVARECQYIRIGTIVHVAARIDLQVTSVGAFSFDFTTPISTNNFTSGDQANGVLSNSSVASIPGGGGLVATNVGTVVSKNGTGLVTAAGSGSAGVTTLVPYCFSFSYRVI